jgi:hypothetical protein
MEDRDDASVTAESILALSGGELPPGDFLEII